MAFHCHLFLAATVALLLADGLVPATAANRGAGSFDPSRLVQLS
jgi:prolyl 4-hydroxylase